MLIICLAIIIDTTYTTTHSDGQQWWVQHIVDIVGSSYAPRLNLLYFEDL